MQRAFHANRRLGWREREMHPWFQRRHCPCLFRTAHEADMRPPRVQSTSIAHPIFNRTNTRMDHESNPPGCPDEKMQYPEEDVHPLDWAKSKSTCLGLIRFGRIYHYRIHTLNAPGNPPAVNGQPPFVVTPYMISPEHRDSNRSLGAYE